MEWIGIGIMLAIGYYLAPIVLLVVTVVFVGIVNFITKPFR